MEEGKPNWDGQERRQSPRVAGDGELLAAVVDAHGQVRRLLEQARVVNVSGGGVAFTSVDGCEPGLTVRVRLPESSAKPFSVRIIGSKLRGDGRSELRGQLIHGAVPACLMYGWRSA